MRSAGSSRFLSLGFFFRIGQLDDNGRVPWLVLFVADRGVNEQSADMLRPPVASMDMAEDMHFRLRPFHCRHKLLAADMLGAEVRGNLVMDSHRGAVSDQDVEALGDQVPFSPNRLAPVKVESPVEERGLMGASIQLKSPNSAPAIFKIFDV